MNIAISKFAHLRLAFPLNITGTPQMKSDLTAA